MGLISVKRGTYEDACQHLTTALKYHNPDQAHIYHQEMSTTSTTKLEVVHISEDLIPTKTTYHLRWKLISEDSSLLRCYALLLVEQFQTFQRIIVHSSSGPKCLELLIQQNTEHPRDFHLKHQPCENLKSCIKLNSITFHHKPSKITRQLIRQGLYYLVQRVLPLWHGEGNLSNIICHMPHSKTNRTIRNVNIS
jgi:hypothetical protein